MSILPLFMDYDNMLYLKKHKDALFKARQIRNKPCSVCGLYGCICQEKLSPLLKKRRAVFRLLIVIMFNNVK